MNQIQEETSTRGIQCPICMNVNPGKIGEQPLIVLTSCGHAYCDGCLTTHIQTVTSRDCSPNFVPCPTCKKTFNSQNANHKLRIFASVENVPHDNELSAPLVMNDQDETIATLAASMKNDTIKLILKLNEIIAHSRNSSTTDATSRLIFENRSTIKMVIYQLMRIWCERDWRLINNEEGFDEIMECSKPDSPLIYGCVFIREDSFIMKAFCFIIEIIKYESTLLSEISELRRAFVNWITSARFSPSTKDDLCCLSTPLDVLIIHFNKLCSSCSHDNQRFVTEWKELWTNVFRSGAGIFTTCWYSDGFSTTEEMFKPLKLLKKLITACLDWENEHVSLLLLQDDYVSAVMFPIDQYLETSQEKHITISKEFASFMTNLIDLYIPTRGVRVTLGVPLLKILMKLREIDGRCFIEIITSHRTSMDSLMSSCLNSVQIVKIFHECGKNSWVQMIESFFLRAYGHYGRNLRRRHRDEISQLITDMTCSSSNVCTDLMNCVENFEDFRKHELLVILLRLSEFSDEVTTLISGNKRNRINNTDDDLETVDEVDEVVLPDLQVNPSKKRGRPRKVETVASTSIATSYSERRSVIDLIENEI